MLSSANILRTSLDASSSAWPGATSAVSCTVNWRFDRCSVLGPRPRSISRDVVDPHRPADRRHREPADFRRVAPLVLEHPHLDRVAAPALPCRIRDPSSPATASRSVLPTVDMRTPRSAARLPIDGDVNLGIRHAQAQLRLGQARCVLRRRRAPSSSTRPAARDRDRGCSPKWRSRPGLRRCPARCATRCSAGWPDTSASRLPHLR